MTEEKKKKGRPKLTDKQKADRVFAKAMMSTDEIPLPQEIIAAEAVLQGVGKGDKSEIAKVAGFEGNHKELIRIGRNLIESSRTQQYIMRRRKEMMEAAQVHTNEIIGTQVEIMRGADIELFLDDEGNPSIEVARANGVTNMIREFTVLPRPGRDIIVERTLEDGTVERTVTPTVIRTIKFKLHDRMKASMNAAEIFGLKAVPRTNAEAMADIAARELVAKCEIRGVTLSYEDALERVRPDFIEGEIISTTDATESEPS